MGAGSEVRRSCPTFIYNPPSTPMDDITVFMCCLRDGDLIVRGGRGYGLGEFDRQWFGHYGPGMRWKPGPRIDPEWFNIAKGVKGSGKLQPLVDQVADGSVAALEELVNALRREWRFKWDLRKLYLDVKGEGDPRQLINEAAGKEVREGKWAQYAKLQVQHVKTILSDVKCEEGRYPFLVATLAYISMDRSVLNGVGVVSLGWSMRKILMDLFPSTCAVKIHLDFRVFEYLGIYKDGKYRDPMAALNSLRPLQPPPAPLKLCPCNFLKATCPRKEACFGRSCKPSGSRSGPYKGTPRASRPNPPPSYPASTGSRRKPGKAPGA